HGIPALRFAVITRRADVIEWLVERGAVRVVGDAFEAPWAAWGGHGEGGVDSGLVYGGDAPGLGAAAKPGGRCAIADEGRAFEAAGKPANWREAARRIQAEYTVNIGGEGVVSLPATDRRDLDWLVTLVERIPNASRAFYGELLELDEDLHSD